MAKDRAAPFSRKHRKYWLPVTGGMLLIGAINVALGYWMWSGDHSQQPVEKIDPFADGRDAGVRDAGSATR